MSPNRDAKVQQILELFQAGDYRVDPDAVAGSVIRRMSVQPRSDAGSSVSGVPGRSDGRRIRGIVSVTRGHARVAAF